MSSLKDLHLILFLTEGTTLQDWARTGLLSREAELYQALRPHVASIAWLTYGGAGDLAYQDQLGEIEILYNRWRLPNAVYIQQLPWLHQAAFQRATILKAEQTGAASAALRVARHYGKRLIARSGFSLALFAGYNPADYNQDQAQIIAFEGEVFQAAAQIVVTTEEMRATALATHGLNPQKIRVIPNYVNTERFKPSDTPKNENDPPRILFAGRLTAQKNVLALLEAIAPMKDVQIQMIGGGELREILAERIQREGLSHIELIGNVPNSELAAYFQNASIYAQPSHYEGHPKTIFEAMACGLPVLSADVPGVRQFIQHGETGWLTATDAESIRAGMQTLLADSDLRLRLGVAGRAFVQEHFALSAIIPQELALWEDTLTIEPPPPKPFKRPFLRSIWTYAGRILTLIRRRLAT